MKPSREQLVRVIQIQAEVAKLGLDLGGVMQFVVGQSLSLIGADGAVIELAEDGEMVYRAASGIASPQLGLRLKIENSLSGLCVVTGEALSCEDSETDPRVDRMACRRVGLRSMIVIPLKHKEITVGVLKAVSKHAKAFDQNDMALLEMLSEVIAASMYFSAKYDSDDLFVMATHDGMTGLPNRALFMDRLRNAITLSTRNGDASGILMIDMDGLKQVNDAHGHRIGDAVILEFAKRLKSVTRETDTAARIGGDEFGIVLTPLTDPDSVKAVAQQIQSELNPLFHFEESQFKLKASIGAALIPSDGTDPEKLMDLADKRMYVVKQARTRV